MSQRINQPKPVCIPLLQKLCFKKELFPTSYFQLNLNETPNFGLTFLGDSSSASAALYSSQEIGAHNLVERKDLRKKTHHSFQWTTRAEK